MVNSLYAAIAEGQASELAARRTAMENATKNAGEMIDKLTLLYNRSRQAAITNELVDIITGGFPHNLCTTRRLTPLLALRRLCPLDERSVFGRSMRNKDTRAA
jgi:hypothetical protein